MLSILRLAVISAALAAAIVSIFDVPKIGPAPKADRSIVAPAPGLRTGEAEATQVRPVRVIRVSGSNA